MKGEKSQTPDNVTGDFLLDHNVIASVYIVLSLLSVTGNCLICAIIFRCKRMRVTPKYWIVLVITFALIVQALFSNSIMSAKEINEEFPGSCWIWSAAVIYGNYAGLAIVTYLGLLLHVDFLFCLLSSSYMTQKRPATIVILMFLTLAIVLGTLISMSIVLGEDVKDTDISCGFHMDKPAYQNVMLWVVLFIPVTLSVLCCLAIFLCRASRSVQTFLGVNSGIVCESMETEVSSVLPPADHLTFLFFEILMYFPFAVASYGETCSHYDACPQLFSFLVICSSLSDNAGALIHLSWYFFIDMRKGIRRIFRLSPTKLRVERSTSETDDLRVFDVYPYCVMSIE